MCSIAGSAHKGDEKIVRAMLAFQHHRAPDDEGVVETAQATLGMGRLKIIDLVSPGLCPYQEDGFVLCFNGEIYNYIELCKELKQKGWKFRTTSDTEVLMKAYRQWGLKMFDRLNGMFAITIYDPSKKQLLLARDIAGEKPLYYYHTGKKFLFASEVKAFQGQVPLILREDRFFEAFQLVFEYHLRRHGR